LEYINRVVVGAVIPGLSIVEGTVAVKRADEMNPEGFGEGGDAV
jgi:hypothetical protein